jgi:phage-related minor tail protein
MASKDKWKKTLFSDNISELFVEGTKVTLMIMIISIITMWLVSIFTNYIAKIDMGIMVVMSTGIAISFGTYRIYEITIKNLK